SDVWMPFASGVQVHAQDTALKHVRIAHKASVVDDRRRWHPRKRTRNAENQLLTRLDGQSPFRDDDVVSPHRDAYSHTTLGVNARRSDEREVVWTIPRELFESA